ncbi:MAG TPA: hypothetical protein EYP67_08385 [Methanosarcinales archaeon]|nr:hypothetical protein [Methanosarcinales archaeon]
MNNPKLMQLGICISAILTIAAVTVQSCSAATPAMDKIRFTDLPPTIDIKPGSRASFDVTLKNYGNQYADVSINARSVPDAITIVGDDETKLVDMGKSVTYHITIRADDDIAPGIYQFEIADKSGVDQHTWEAVSVRVKGEGVSIPPSNAGSEETEAEKSSGFGIVALVSALLLAYRYGCSRP